MARNAAIEAVLEAERRGGLWQQRVLGYPVWPLERLRRYRQELLEGALEERTGPDASLSSRLQALTVPLVQSARDLRRGLPFARAAEAGRDIWVLTTSNYRRPDADGVPQCIFAEDLREQLGERLLFLERTTNDLRTAAREDVFDIDLLYIGAMLGGKALSPALARTRVLEPGQAEAFAPMDPAYVCQLALFGRALERMAHGWIARARPRAVFVLCGYQPFIPIQRAVRAAGIPLIELQHGLVHDSHPGYVLGEGYDDSHLPDHLVTFGDYWSTVLDGCSAHWQGRQSVGGHAWLRRMRRPSRQRDGVALFSQADPPVRAQLREVALALRRALPDSIRVVLKPHPRETDARTHWGDLREHGIELADHASDSYALLGRCRLSVAVFSTVAIEALAFGCESVVMRSPLWTDDIRLMVEQGKLTAAETADDVVRALDRSAELGGAGDHESLADALFGVNAPPLDYEALIAGLSR